MGFPSGTSGKEPICQYRKLRDVSSIPGSERSPGGGNGNPLPYSCPENPMDRRAWWTTMVDYQRVGRDWAHGISHILLPRMLSPPLGRFSPQHNFFLFELFHILKEQVHFLSLTLSPLPSPSPYFSLPLVNVPYSALPLPSLRFCFPTFLYTSTCNILQKNSSEHFAQPSILSALCL